MTDDEEDGLFREAMGDVSPLRDAKRVMHKSEPAAPTAAQLERRDAALGIRREVQVPDTLTLGEVPAVAPRDFLEWRKEGVQLQVADRLRKGHYAPAAELDLHGHTVKEARVRLYQFVLDAVEAGHRAVLVSHGRGEQSATPARLKSYVAAWLPCLSAVNAFASATRDRGGTGAVFVLLSKRRVPPEA